METRTARSRASRLAYAAVAVMLVGIAAMWVYALFFAKDHVRAPNLLRDRAFPAAAQQACEAAQRELDDLGLVAVKARSTAERADLVERSDEVLRRMVSELRALGPPAGDEARAVTEWLGDWETWLEDREAWAAQLRTGDDGPFLERAREGGEPNSRAVNVFAVVNDMPDCATPANA
ncbi:MAG: hypothetical protein ACT4PW_08605 [Acidimicrobiia bacterium]